MTEAAPTSAYSHVPPSASASTRTTAAEQDDHGPFVVGSVPMDALQAIRDRCDRINSAHRAATSAAAEQAWQHVQASKSVAQHRDSVTEDFKAALQEFGHNTYWTDTLLMERFGLHTMLDGDASAAGDHTIGSVRRPLATVMRNNDPSRKAHTLMFDAVQTMQRQLASIEESLIEMHVEKIPNFSEPFADFATFINRDLLTFPNAQAQENEFLDRMRALRKRKAEVRQVALNSERPNAAVMWGALDEEGRVAQEMSRASAVFEADVRSFEDQAVPLFDKLEQVKESCSRRMTTVRNDSISSSQTATSVREKLDEVAAQSDEAYARAMRTLDRQASDSQGSIKRSQQHAEKAWRKIRELLKEAAKHDDAVQGKQQELLATLQTTAEMKHMKAQFDASVQVRRKRISDSIAISDHLTFIIEKLSGVIEFGLKEAQSHVKRIASEENARRCRGLEYIWRSSGDLFCHYGDILYVREQRRKGLARRCKESWQLEFLCKHDLEVAKTQVAELRAQQAETSKSVEKVQMTLTRRGVPCVSFTALDSDKKLLTERQFFAAVEEGASKVKFSVSEPHVPDDVPMPPMDASTAAALANSVNRRSSFTPVAPHTPKRPDDHQLPAIASATPPHPPGTPLRQSGSSTTAESTPRAPRPPKRSLFSQSIHT